MRSARITGTTAGFWEQCAKRVEECGYVRTWQTAWRYSKDRKRSAALRFVHDIDCFRVIAVIRDRGYEVKRKVLATEEPDEIPFDKLLGSIKWTSGSTFDVIGKYGGLIARVEAPTLLGVTKSPNSKRKA